MPTKCVLHPNMAAQTVYPVGVVMLTPLVGVPMGGEEHGVTELPRSELAAPQLVMLANVALTSEGGGSGGGCDHSSEEKQMVELKTVGSSCYSDSDDEGLAHSSYGDGGNSDITDSHHADTSFSVYPETPQVVSCHSYKGQEEEEEEEAQETEGEGRGEEAPPSPTGIGHKRKRTQRLLMENCRSKKKPFHCKPCQYEAECEEEFIHHIRVHSAKKLIAVEQAQEEEEEPDRGAESAPEGGGEGAVYTKGVIRCERCGYNTNRYDHYMAHLKHHNKEGDSQRVYKCTICTYTTISQYHWKKHLRNHFPSKLYTCGQCCYFSDRKNNYVQHIRTHTGERPFRCSYCKYSSSQKTHLTRHMRTHSGERPFKCDSCSYLAANQHEVTRHARQVHNGPKPLSCPHCQYKTADRSNYKKHVELHVNPRQFLCPVCTYAASKKCNLQYHVKSRHPDCSEITLDVSKVKLRIKKPGSSAPTYYSVGKEARYVLTGIKEGRIERKVGRREGAMGGGEGREEAVAADRQPIADPINLSTKKSSKANPPSTATKKEQRDKTPKRREEKETSKRREEKETSKRREEKETSKRREEKETPKRREERETPKRKDERETPRREERETPKRESMRKAQNGVTEEKRGEKPGERKERGGGKVAGKRGEQRKGAEQKKNRDTCRTGKASKTAGVTAETQPRKESKVKKMANAMEEKEEWEQDRGEAEKAEEERVVMERERAEKERLEKERAEKERLEKEQAEKERAKQEREKMEKEGAERARVEKEKMEKEGAERARVEKEKMEKERAERARVEKEKMEKERAERERLEKARVEKERKGEDTAPVKSGRRTRAVRAVGRTSRGKIQEPAEETQGEEAKVTSRKRKASACQPPPPQNEAPAQPSRKLAAEERRPQRSSVLRGRSEALQRGQGPEGSGGLSESIDPSPGVSVIKRTKKTRATPGPAETKPGPTEAKPGSTEAREGLDLARQGSVRGTSPKQCPSGEEDILMNGVEEAGTSTCQKPAGGGKRTGERGEAGRGRVNEGADPGRGPEAAEGKVTAAPHRPELSVTRQGKATVVEEDEGIHSHDGSDISDSVSEGSDDSGLHGVAVATPAAKPAGPGTAATTPAATPVTTPTEGPPSTAATITPQSHRCIFCDRTFNVEVEYRLHLNRHLVNVYYLESAAKGDQ
ncbi:RE1-silencing transcription factor [Anguilla anguilla]|uniref:RE1-silencing transcription factor n=1 Tax=Anguilla anguilla TaxID=7936 RepID=UPI0015AFA3E9|nr:RE1-silencing transcription factor [Anguilla anguilla]